MWIFCGWGRSLDICCSSIPCSKQRQRPPHGEVPQGSDRWPYPTQRKVQADQAPCPHVQLPPPFIEAAPASILVCFQSPARQDLSHSPRAPGHAPLSHQLGGRGPHLTHRDSRLRTHTGVWPSQGLEIPRILPEGGEWSIHIPMNEPKRQEKHTATLAASPGAAASQSGGVGTPSARGQQGRA